MLIISKNTSSGTLILHTAFLQTLMDQAMNSKYLFFFISFSELFLKAAAGLIINSGPIKIGSGGVRFDFGFEKDNFSIGGAISNVHDDLKVGAEEVGKQL